MQDHGASRARAATDGSSPLVGKLNANAFSSSGSGTGVHPSNHLQGVHGSGEAMQQPAKVRDSFQ